MSIRKSEATGAAAIALTVAPGYAWQIHEIRCHLSAGGAATDLTATIDANAGSVYDAVIYTKAMNAVTDFSERFEPPLLFEAGDELDIAYGNGGAATYGIQVFYKPAN